MNAACPTCGQVLTGAVLDDSSGDGWRSILGDCIGGMRGMDDGAFDALVTDPPYGSGGFSVAERSRDAKTKYVSSGAKYKDNLPDMANDSLHPHAWTAMMREFLQHAHRLLANGGHFLCFIDWRQLPELATLVHGSGMRMRGYVVWDKGRGARPYRNGFRMQAEYVIWATRGALRDRVSPFYLDGVQRIPTLGNGKRHISQKPLALLASLLQCVEAGGHVLDPFQGSGTTGVAARALGLRYTGVEIVPEMWRTACERLRGEEVA